MKLCLKNVAQAGLLSSIIALAACSGSDVSRAIGSDGLVISGKLGGSSLMSMNKISAKAAQDNNSFAVEFDDYEDLEIVATAQTDPPTTATGSVDASGNFSVDLGADAAGTAITVTFVNENTDAVVGEVKFTDTSTTDLNGNPKADSAVVATGSLQLGNIVLAEDGTISVPKTTVASAIEEVAVNVATAFNPTGQWTMAAYDKTLPEGYKTVEAVSGTVDGPHIGFKLTLARFTGKEFTPGTGNCVKNASGTITSCPVTSGTVGTNDRYVLSIWGGDYSESIGACGHKTGFTEDEARGYGRTHLTTLPTISGSTILFGGYQFSSVSGGTGVAPYDQPWMASPVSTTAMHSEQDCRPISVSGSTRVLNGWACRAPIMYGTQPGTPVSAGTKGWMVGLQGSGCINADTLKPVNVTDWNTIKNATCLQPTSGTVTGFTGFRSESCVYANVDPDGVSNTAQTTMNIKCVHSGGQFNDNAGEPNFASPYIPSGGEFIGQPEPLLAQDAQCHTAGTSSTARVLAGYRCFANAYYQLRDQLSSGGCSRDYNFNWNATKPEDFVRRDDFKGRPKNAFLTNILNYAADGQSAVLEDEESENVQIQGSSDSNTFCRVVLKTQITIKAVTATKLLFELKDSGRMASTEAACIAAANAAALEDKSDSNMNRSELSRRLEPMKMIFYINKQ